MSNQAKAAGGDTSGTGTNSLQVQGVHDPNAARKAIMARAAQLRQAEVELDRETVPGLGYVPGEAATTDVGDTGDTAIQHPRAEQPEPLQSPEPVIDSGQPEPEPQPTQPQQVQGQPQELVTLKVFGKELNRPKAEVDAAGGVEAMQMKLAAEYRQWQASELARKASEAARDAQDKARVLGEKLKQIAAPNGNQPAQPNQATAAALSDEQIVQQLYSGEPEAALAAIRELRAAKQVSPQVDPAQLVELVKAKVESDFAEREAINAQEQQRQAVNELMMSDRFAPIMGNPEVKAMAQREFNAAVRDRRNSGRAWVQIADEVGSKLLGFMGIQTQPSQAATQPSVQQEISTRTNFKRRIPQPSAASDRAPTAEQPVQYPTKPSDIIAMYRAARGQAPR